MTLYPDRRKLALFLSAALLFSAAGGWMAYDGDSRGWFAFGFFLLCAAVLAVNLMPGAAYMRLTGEGLETCSFFRKTCLKWSDVEEFSAGDMMGNDAVFFNYSTTYRGKFAGRMLARGLSGFDGAVGGIYDRSPGELASLLNEWHKRYAAGSRGPRK